MRKLYIAICAFFIFSAASGQTNPTPQSIPYIQDFGTSIFSTPKPGMASWQGSGTRPYPTLAAAEASLSGVDQVITAAAPASNGAAGQYGHTVGTDGRLSVLQSTNANFGSSQIALAIVTTGMSSVTVQYSLGLGVSNARTIGAALQYRVITSSSSYNTTPFTTIAGSSVTYNSSTTNGGDADGVSDLDTYSFNLPAAALGQAEVQLRWITWRGSEAGSSSGISLDNISITGSGGPDVTAPTLSGSTPANNATGIAANSSVTLTFSENIQTGAGEVRVRRSSDNTIVQTIAASALNISGSAASFTLSGLAVATAYYIEVDNGIVKDAAGNIFGGITGSSILSFTTSNIIAQLYSANFSTCATGAPGTVTDGFTRFSVTGAQVWDCTTFGRTGNAMQINGYDAVATTNVINEDWLISPAFNLTATTYPLLTFYSRTKFNGGLLQLKVSTDYSGSGNPNLATWTDINGRFPLQNSDIWTASSSINLSAFKQSSVYFAFVYHSTDEEGSRWTIDDVQLDNSATPPPASLTLNTNDVQFTYVASGSTAVKTFTITGNDITTDITLTAGGAFQLSTDGTSFSNSISFTQAVANNVPKTVYVRFAPTQANENFTATINVASSSLTAVVNLKGTSIDPAITLEVVNWNVEWFGSPTLGPTNDAQQEQNVKTIMQNVGADLFGLVEVVDESRLANVVSQMPGYSYIIGNFGSHAAPVEAGGSALNTVQKPAFVYKTSIFSNVTTRPLINNQNTTSASYNNWASGRFPFLMKADVTLNGQTRTINFILIHAKANTSPTATSYTRRKAAATELYDTLLANFSSDYVMILGDFNDDLDQSITDGQTVTSYSSFTNDNTNFFSPTLSLSLAGKKSTVSYNDVIDHVMLSNEMQQLYLNGSATILSDVSSLVSNYGSTTTDHYPVLSRYSFAPSAIPLPVKLSSFTAEKRGRDGKLSWTTSSEINTREFMVERSVDGRSFTSIGSVAANGNTNALSVYSLTDQQPNAGRNYYRLQMIDVDGRATQSSIVRLDFDKAFTVSFSPNPVKDILTIRVANLTSAATLEIIDMNGKKVQTKQLVNPVSSISTSGFGKGYYLVRITSNGHHFLDKIIVE